MKRAAAGAAGETDLLDAIREGAVLRVRRMMKGMQMDGKNQDGSKTSAVHKATGMVKKVDAEKGRVTLAHEPVESLKWPAMTMGFSVKDKMLFDKLAVGKKADVEFVKQGADYIITAVK
jgi:Cu(I)/Ag(I) efflux system protein CusF